MPIQYAGRLARQIVGRDISERKKSEKTIKYMAYHDSLTGLPNRNMFGRYLNKRLNSEETKEFAVLFLDLDRFKSINDTKGHTVGDQMLKEVADRLKTVVSKSGMVSRQGGDEFIILLENMGKDQVKEIGNRILSAFSQPIPLRNEDFFITPSIGISLYPKDGEDQDTLIKHADTAMYLAKEKGKNNLQFYSVDLDILASKKTRVGERIKKSD